MNWIDSFIEGLNYIEEHLLDDINADEISKNLYISSFYFQKAFNIYTGISISEYIRNRRLYKAALELRSFDVSILDTAIKYHYESAEAFSRAFKRFHGFNPSLVKNLSNKIKIYMPLKVKISIEGGTDMNYRVEEEKNLKFIGYSTIIKEGEGYDKCPKFWDEIMSKYGNKEEFQKNNIGEYAVCIDSCKGEFEYIIAGKYNGNEVPEGMKLFEFPTLLWAKFVCVGPLPATLQTINEQIWKEWLPNNQQYELAFPGNIEWYDDPTIYENQDNYKSEIWVPVKQVK